MIKEALEKMNEYEKLSEFMNEIGEFNYKTQDQLFFNGLLGNYDSEQLFCNEKDITNKGFIFKCGKGCKHDND